LLSKIEPMKQESSDKLLEAIREKTKELTQSKEKAREYLRESGIADMIEQAKKRNNQNGNAPENKNTQ